VLAALLKLQRRRFFSDGEKNLRNRRIKQNVHLISSYHLAVEEQLSCRILLKCPGSRVGVMFRVTVFVFL